MKLPVKRIGGFVVASALLGGIALLSSLPAAGEVADLYLINGVRLRGDVTREGDEIILRNAAGELRFAASEVARIVPLSTAEGAPGTQPASPAGPESTSRPAGAGAEPRQPPEDASEELAPAPWVSDRDINHLRLGELTLDGPAEPVRVRFRRKAGDKDVEEAVLEELRQRADFRPEWTAILTNGRPEEKLQLIVRETGMKYAERIVVESDPQAFVMFRRNVLPLIHRGCARSGCHGGRNARVFRFPIGSLGSERYAYTSFVLLDEMITQRGPLLDRTNPPGSVLLGYLLPQDANPLAHPDVGRGPSFKPVLRDDRDPRYAPVVDWINFLIVPKPQYDLEYENPNRGPFPTLPPDAAPAEGAPPADTTDK